MNFEGIIAIINRRLGIYNQVINSWPRREGEGGRGAAGINCIAGKGCHLQLDLGAGMRSLLPPLFFLRSRAPQASLPLGSYH